MVSATAKLLGRDFGDNNVSSSCGWFCITDCEVRHTMAVLMDLL